MMSELRFGYVDTSGGQVHYAEVGAGPTVVLMPHGGRSGAMFSRVMPLLADRYRVVTIDMPGSGSSYSPSSILTIPEIAAVMLEAIDALEPGRLALYGINGGNKLASWIAAQRPERIWAYIHAGLAHSILFSNEERDHALGSHAGVAHIVGGVTDSTPLLPEDWADRLIEAGAIDPAGDPDYVSGFAIDTMRASFYRPHFYRAVQRFDMESSLRAITAPALVIETAVPSQTEPAGLIAERVARQLREADAASARSVTFELCADEAVSLEHRAQEFADVLLAFLDEVAPVMIEARSSDSLAEPRTSQDDRRSRG